MIVLASRSPQRRAILEQLGIAFEIRPADVDELEEGDPVEVAVENARRKAAAIGGDRTLGVDTLVELDGTIYGKPRDPDHARATLRALSGRTHRVISGLCFGGRTVRAVTEVSFRAVEPYLDWYLAAGEWEGRAGGYAIQGRGAAFVTAIRGDYFNVVGLPVAALLELAPDLIAA